MEYYIDQTMFENSVELVGIVTSEKSLFYTCIDQEFYYFTMKIKRQKGKIDYVRICIPKHIANEMTDSIKGKAFKVIGEIRTQNIEKGEKNTTEVYVFSKDIEIIERFKDSMYKNEVILSGNICTDIHYKQVCSNTRSVVNFIIAVRRKVDKASYIPCVSWNDNAELLKTKKVSNYIRVTGRFQSRYLEKFSKDVYEILIKTVMFE